MKNILLLIALALCLFSCEKDMNDNSGPKNSHRIKQVIINSDFDEDLKIDFNYKGENLIKYTINVKNEEEVWVEWYKTDFSYSQDMVTAITYIKEKDEWKLDCKAVYTIENNMLLAEHDYGFLNGSWTENAKFIYQYSGNLLIAYQRYFDYDENGIIELDSKGDFFFQNGKVIECREYTYDNSGILSYNYVDSFAYNGDILAGWVRYGSSKIDPWNKKYKAAYQYSGGYVSQLDHRRWDEITNQWATEPFSHQAFVYDKNGYVIETSTHYGDKSSLTYEKGHGNAALFFSEYPIELVYQIPTFK
jgi:hypothetical protein